MSYMKKIIILISTLLLSLSVVAGSKTVLNSVSASTLYFLYTHSGDVIEHTVGESLDMAIKNAKVKAVTVCKEMSGKTTFTQKSNLIIEDFSVGIKVSFEFTCS